MYEDDRYAERAAAWLRVARTGSDSETPQDESSAIAAIAGAIRASRRRRRARRWLGTGLVAVSSGIAVLALLSSRGPAPTGATGTAQVATFRAFTVLGVTPKAVAAGEMLSTGTQPLLLRGDDGTVIGLGPGTEAVLVRADSVRWFQLNRGSFDAHVATLHPGERFVVATPDRQVEVRGTTFHVVIAPADGRCGGGTVTRLVVDEGVVTVRGPRGGDDRVGRGERWPAGCDVVGVKDPSPRPQPVPRRSHGAEMRRPASYETQTPSTLGAENDLFERAGQAEHAGDLRAALGLLNQLIEQFPSSPLRETAEADRRRIIERAVAPTRRN